MKTKASPKEADSNAMTPEQLLQRLGEIQGQEQELLQQLSSSYKDKIYTALIGLYGTVASIPAQYLDGIWRDKEVAKVLKKLKLQHSVDSETKEAPAKGKKTGATRKPRSGVSIDDVFKFIAQGERRTMDVKAKFNISDPTVNNKLKELVKAKRIVKEGRMWKAL